MFMCMAEGSEKPKSEWSVNMTCHKVRARGSHLALSDLPESGP